MIAQLNGPYLRSRPGQAAKRLLACLLFEGRAPMQSARWANLLARPLHAITRHLPCPRRVRKPIYIMGTGRSGTTILGTVLSYHRQVGYLNEPKAMWHAATPDQDVMGNFTDRPASIWLSSDAATPRVRRRFHRLYGWFLTGTLSSRVVDKNAELVFRFDFLRSLFPDARFLLLVRNGYDTCTSIHKWSQQHSQPLQQTDWWGRDSRKWRMLIDEVVAKEADLAANLEAIRSLDSVTDRAAVEWIVNMRQGMRLAEQHPEAVHVVRYEELTRQPVATLQKLVAFCELSDDPGFYDYSATVLQPNQPRPPLELSPLIRPAFDQTMRQLGYEPASPSPAATEAS